MVYLMHSVFALRNFIFLIYKKRKRYARCWWHVTLHTLSVEKNTSHFVFHYCVCITCVWLGWEGLIVFFLGFFFRFLLLLFIYLFVFNLIENFPLKNIELRYFFVDKKKTFTWQMVDLLQFYAEIVIFIRNQVC